MPDPKYQATVRSRDHVELARQAVRESLVLLVNNNNILPLSKVTPVIFVAGEGANDIGLQSGGWTLEWQGMTGNDNEGTTIFSGIKAAVDPATQVEFNREADFSEYKDADGNPLIADVGIVVLAEQPYAEGVGDSADISLNEKEIQLLERTKEQSKRLVVILLSGRPRVIAEQLPLADAWVAAWWPGTEGGGIADVLFGEHPFTGKTAYSWPRSNEQLPINVNNTAGKTGCEAPLFPFGYGLTNGDRSPEILDLRLHLPTLDPDSRDYLVRTRLHSVSVTWPVLRTPATGVTGDLEIHNREISAPALQGVILDGPFQLNVQPGPVGGDVSANVLLSGSGMVEFHNAGLSAKLDAGQVGGLRLRTAQVVIDDLKRPTLDIDATGSGDIAKALAVLEGSPLGPTLGAQFMALSGQGPADYSLHLRLPTLDPDSRDYLVRTKLRSVSVTWPVLRTPATGVTGDLEIGQGSLQHLSGALLATSTGTNLLHVAYKGGGPGTGRRAGWPHQHGVRDAAGIGTAHQARASTGLAVTSPKRSPAMPELPSIAETGIAGYEVTNWYGVLAPVATRKPVIDRLNRGIVEALRTPELTERLQKDGVEPISSAPTEFQKHILAEIARWEHVVAAAGSKAD